MRYIRGGVWALVLSALLVVSGCAVRAPQPTPLTMLPASSARPQLMTISPGDVLEVIIRRGAGEERYTSTVRENGLLSVAFVDVQTAGLTALEAEALLREALAPFIREPRVQVVFQQKVVRDRIFVFGEVHAPGVFPLRPGMTVADALGEANGYTEEAHLPSVRVLRGGVEQPQVLAANVAQLFLAGDLEQNLLLKDQDIVYVPRTRIGDWNQFIEEIRPTLGVITMPMQSIILYRAIAN